MTDAATRRRLLVLAESAHPVSQSGSWVGWSHTRALAERNDVHLVTRVANREAILSTGLREGHDFTTIDLDALERKIIRFATWLSGDPNKGLTTLTALTLPFYLAFEREVWRLFGKRIKARAFDLVHRITPVTPTMPSLVAARCARAGIPFVLGPLNGGLPWPKDYTAIRHAEGEWLSYLRAAHRLAPYYRTTRARAAAILVGSLDTYRQVPKSYAAKCIYLPENGIDMARFAPGSTGANVGDDIHRPLRALFVGRLVPYKGCALAIEALAPLLRLGRATLTIVGDGPERPALDALTARLEIGDRVTFTGIVPPYEVARNFQASDVLVFPSVREFGGGVVLEAMTMGVVPVVLEYGGPGELVSADCGVKVPIGAPADVVVRFRSAVAHLADEPARRRAMVEAARLRVRNLFTWPRKAEQTEQVYAWVLGQRPTKPDFHFLEGKSDLPAR